MRILKENFEAALMSAIIVQVQLGNTNTTFTQGLREVLKASEQGETITVEED
jgi:hypothetical protein